MEYLLKVEEIEKLKSKLKLLDDEATSISSEINRLVREDREFLYSDRYKILKKRVMFGIPNEKKEIEEKLKHVKIISDSDCVFDGITISIFTKVTLDYEGEIESYTIVPTAENDSENNQISCNTPIAQAILGKKIGDKIKFGNTMVTILDVQKC